MANAGYGYTPFGSAALGRLGGNLGKTMVGSSTQGGGMAFGGGYRGMGGGAGQMGPGGKIMPPQAPQNPGAAPVGRTPPIYAGGATPEMGPNGNPAKQQGNPGGGWTGANGPGMYQQNPFASTRMLSGGPRFQGGGRNMLPTGPRAGGVGGGYSTPPVAAGGRKPPPGLENDQQYLLQNGFWSQQQYNDWLAQQTGAAPTGGGGAA